MKKIYLFFAFLAIIPSCPASLYLPGEEDLRTLTNPAAFPNPTAFNQARFRAFNDLNNHYKRLIQEGAPKEELLTGYLSKTELIHNRGFFIVSDYNWTAIPIEAAIMIGETFERPDLAAPFCISTRTAGMKELLRIYAKHWKTCPHRANYPYIADWASHPNASIYRCCFAVVPLFKTYFVSGEHSTHEHFIKQGIESLLEEYKDNPGNFTGALTEISAVVGTLSKHASAKFWTFEAGKSQSS
ncbi:MAG: hypothetical protein ACK5TR_00780 [Alphaproteobacteria bacterium]|jgi:hypothetical protein|nr:hypothetical protein [Alphaproteobacteria bacterium]